VLTDRTLADIAVARPDSLAALRQVKGVGDGKLAKYGDAILSALGCRHAGSLEHCS